MRLHWIVLMLGVWVLALTSVPGLTQEKTKITIWVQTTPGAQEALDILLRDYEKFNPDVKAEQEAMTVVKFDEKIAVALAGRGGPDIYNISDRYMPQFYPKGFIEPLDPKAFGFKDLQAYKVTWLPNSLDPFMRKGKLYAVPRELNIYSLLINTTAFKDSGLDPKKDYPRTWDEVVTVGKKLVRIDAKGFMTREAVHFPFRLYWAWYALYLGPLMNALGGDYLSEDKTKCTMNEEPGVAALQYWYDAYYKHHIASIDRAQDDIYPEVAKGTICMFPGAAWARSVMATYNPDFVNHYDIVPGPGINGKKSVDMTMWAYCVNSFSKNKLESMKILNHITADPGTWQERAGWMLPRIWVLDTPQMRNIIGRDAWQEDIKYARPQLVHENVGEIGDALIRAVQRTLYDKMPAKKSLDMMAEEVNKIIAEK